MKVAELRAVHRVVRAGGGLGSRPLLAGVSLAVGAGEIVAVVGPSGTGKTTLLHILGALDQDYQGDVQHAGQSIAHLNDDQRARLRNQSMGFVFQSFHLLEHLTVAQNVAVPLWLQSHSPDKKTIRQRVQEVLSWVGLAARSDDSVPALSGGERQRVAMARALVHGPTLLLADEPTGHLDPASAEALGGLIQGASERGCAVVMATHDAALAQRADRIMRLEHGRLEALCE